MSTSSKQINIQYYAMLREQRGISNEEYLTEAANLQDLYNELKEKFGFCFNHQMMRVAVNDAFVSWDRTLEDNDKVISIPPVAGG